VFAGDAADKSSGVSGSFASFDLFDDGAFIGPAAGEDGDQAAASFCDAFAVDKDLKLPAVTDANLRLDAGVGFDPGRETRSPRKEASRVAVADFDLHGWSVERG
jgi:hypothetical protein